MREQRPCPPPHPDPSRPSLILPQGSCDTHCHVFGPADTFPYSENRAYTPEDAPKARLQALHRLLGISRVVYVQASCHGFDNRAMLDAMADDPVNTRGVALLPLDVGRDEIAALDAAGVRGARLNFMTRITALPDLDACTALAERIAEFGWHLVIHFDPDLLPGLIDWIRSLPVTVVIDHMGRMSASDIDGPYFKLMLDLLQSETVWCKISGAERSSLAGPPYHDVLPIAHEIVRVAPDRTLWGTDWPHPVLKGVMPDDGKLVDLLEALVPDPAIRHAVLVDNPARLYGF